VLAGEDKAATCLLLSVMRFQISSNRGSLRDPDHLGSVVIEIKNDERAAYARFSHA
jgi:hypothetical protein